MNKDTIIKRAIVGILAAASGLFMSPGFAHHPMGGMTPDTFSQGLLSGLGHPILGLDHLAFLVVAMLLTWTLKGRERFMVPMAFIGASIAGTVMHLGATNIPMSETLVALSVIIVAVLALTRSNPGAFVLGVIFAVSGILHGYALGESIIGSETTPLLAYLAGLATIQYALMTGGVFLMDKIASRSEKLRTIAVRFSSALALLTGGFFLALSIT